MALLAPCGWSTPFPRLSRRDAPALRQRLFRLRDGECADQPGPADALAADRRRLEQRGRRVRAWIRQSDRGRDDRHRHPGHGAVLAASAQDVPMAVAVRSLHRTRRLKLQAFRTVVFVAAAVFFLVPIGAMVEFSTRGNTGQRTLEYWKEIVAYPDMVQAIVASLELAAITSGVMLVLLVPTMVWVRLKLPGLSRIVEFVCLLPLTIPAIVLVVGLFPMYIWLGTNVSDSILTLALAYVVLVLPYCYRALNAGLGAIDVKTLSEAARSLGASWFTVMWRIIVPNISNAILNATLLSVALVLGEYTIANNLLYNNLQVELVHLGRASAGTSIAVAVGSLFFAFVLLVAIAFVGGRPRRQRRDPVAAVAGPLQASQA